MKETPKAKPNNEWTRQPVNYRWTESENEQHLGTETDWQVNVIRKVTEHKGNWENIETQTHKGKWSKTQLRNLLAAVMNKPLSITSNMQSNLQPLSILQSKGHLTVYHPNSRTRTYFRHGGGALGSEVNVSFISSRAFVEASPQHRRVAWLDKVRWNKSCCALIRHMSAPPSTRVSEEGQRWEQLVVSWLRCE